MAGADGLQSSIPNKVPVEANSDVGPAENLEHHSGSAGAPKETRSTLTALLFPSGLVWQTIP